MDILIKTDQETITHALANAIATFNLTKVAELLSEKGEYCIQNGKEETVISNKRDFIKWLGKRLDEFKSVNEDRNQLDYSIDKCSYCRIGNPVIIFENGKFPVYTSKDWEREKCGLMLEFAGNIISDISFCFLFPLIETKQKFSYDGRGNKVGETEYNSNGEIVRSSTNKYDENGNLREVTVIYTDRNGRKSGNKTTYGYESNKNIIEENSFIERGIENSISPDYYQVQRRV